MSKKQQLTSLSTEFINEIKAQETKLADWGFDDLGRKKTVVQEQKEIRRELREQEEHDLKMELYGIQIQNIQKEKKDKELSADTQNFKSNNLKIKKGQIVKQIKLIKKTSMLGKKEKKLLEILSDLKPHTITDLTKKIPSKSCKHLKKNLLKKIKRGGFSINTKKASGFERESFYQLVYFPS